VDNFFDKQGRDRVIHDWLKRNKPDFVSMYEHVLSQREDFRNYNSLFLMVFEAGCAFAKASKTTRSADVDYDYEACSG
jgi:hypothetical protein